MSERVSEVKNVGGLTFRLGSGDNRWWHHGVGLDNLPLTITVHESLVDWIAHVSHSLPGEGSLTVRLLQLESMEEAVERAVRVTFSRYEFAGHDWFVAATGHAATRDGGDTLIVEPDADEWHWTRWNDSLRRFDHHLGGSGRLTPQGRAETCDDAMDAAVASMERLRAATAELALACGLRLAA